MFRDDQRREEAIREARRQSSEEAVQSAFIRGFKYGKTPLALVRGDGVAEPETPADPQLRGVFQDCETFPGLVLFKVVDSAGRLRLKAEMPESDIEPGFVARLEKWLDRHDPVPKMKAI